MLLQAKVAQLQQKLEAAKQAQAASVGREQASSKAAPQATWSAPSTKTILPATLQPVQNLGLLDASKLNDTDHDGDTQRRHLAPLNGRACRKPASPSHNPAQSIHQQIAAQQSLPNARPWVRQQKDTDRAFDGAEASRRALRLSSHQDPSSTGDASSPRQHAAGTSPKPAEALSSARHVARAAAADTPVNAEAAAAAAGETLVTLVGSEDPDDPDWLLALALQEDDSDAADNRHAAVIGDAGGGLPDQAGPACTPDCNQDSQLSSLSRPIRSSENASHPALRPTSAQHGMDDGAADQPHPQPASDLIIDLDCSPDSAISMDVDREAAASDQHAACLSSKPCGNAQASGNATFLLNPSAARPAFAAAGGALGSFHNGAGTGVGTFIRQGADGRGGRSKSLLQTSSRLVPPPAKVGHSIDIQLSEPSARDLQLHLQFFPHASLANHLACRCVMTQLFGRLPFSKQASASCAQS